MSLKDGLKKMSKSDPSDLSRINLTDTKDKIINKIKKAKTDSFSIPNEEDKLKDRPEAVNLLGIYSSVLNQTLDKTLDEFGGKNFSDLKSQLAEVLSSKISPISDEIKKAKTDSLPIPSIEQKLIDRPEAENLLGIYSSISDQTLHKTLEEFGGKNFSDLKSQLAEVLSSKISPISDEIKKLINDQNYLDKILLDGSSKAEEIAGKKIKEMKEIIGF